MNKLCVVIAVIISFLLGGCVSLPGVARGYTAPRNAEEQLAQVDAQLRADCSRESQIANTVIGAGIGVAAGALLSGGGGGRHGHGGSRVPGAVLGGLAGGAIASSATGMDCQQLWQYRQTIQAHINRYQAARQPVSRCVETMRNNRVERECFSDTGVREGWQNYPR